MKLTDVSLEETNALIHVSFQLATSGKKQVHPTLIAKFTGRYRDGSQGNPDTEFMVSILNKATKIWSPCDIILDFSNLTYKWGNGMLEVVRPMFSFCPRVVVVGPDNRKALSSLFTFFYGLDPERDITEVPGFFNSVEGAFQFLQQSQIKTKK